MGNSLLQAAQSFMQNIRQNNQENNLANTPWKQAAIDAIMSGDQAKGQELANNILKSYGFSSPEEAIQSYYNNMGGK